MAEQILCSASRLFHHAVGRRLINANPCAGISLEAIKGAKPPPRKRVMLTAEDPPGDGTPKSRDEVATGALRAFVEEMKASGFVADALTRHGIASGLVARAA